MHSSLGCRTPGWPSPYAVEETDRQLPPSWGLGSRRNLLRSKSQSVRRPAFFSHVPLPLTPPLFALTHRYKPRENVMPVPPDDKSYGSAPGKWSAYMRDLFRTRQPPPLGSVDPDKIEAAAREKLKDSPGALLGYELQSRASCRKPRLSRDCNMRRFDL